jgi:hypothetical protein
VVSRRTILDNLPAAVLVAILAWVVTDDIRRLLAGYPIGVDLEIPLRAAERWLAGQDPYPISAFSAPSGPDLPFLYPPFILPLIAPFTLLPRAVVGIAWAILLVAIAYASARRLGFGLIVGGLVLLWPPYLEALLGGNIQILLFAAYVALMHRDGRQLDPADRERPAALEGILGAFVGALKVSQVHAWVYVLRRRPAAAAIGLIFFGMIALLTLPLVGVPMWFDWLSQAARSGDPDWLYIGAPLSIFVGQSIALVFSVLSVLAVFVVPPRRASAWIGILSIVGAPSLHMFGLLFLLPGMVLIRREIALVAAILVATYQAVPIWIAVVLVAWTLAAMDRWPSVLKAQVAAPNPSRVWRWPPTAWRRRTKKRSELG